MGRMGMIEKESAYMDAVQRNVSRLNAYVKLVCRALRPNSTGSVELGCILYLPECVGCPTFNQMLTKKAEWLRLIKIKLSSNVTPKKLDFGFVKTSSAFANSLFVARLMRG